MRNRKSLIFIKFIRMNALIALLAKERQNLSINSYHEKVCFLNLFIAERGYKIILQPLQKLVIYGRIVNYSLSPTKDFNNAMHQVLNHRRKKKLRQRNEYMYANSFWIWMEKNGEKIFNQYNEHYMYMTTYYSDFQKEMFFRN